MRIDYLASDILLFRGDSLAALATAFIDGKRVLLVDALASEYDAIEMRDYLERDQGLRVESILLTRSGKPYESGLHLFHAARIAVASASAPVLDWGRHRLAFFQTPGDPARSLAIEANGELLFVRDRLVGAVAVLGESTPEAAERALACLQQRAPVRVVPATQGVQEGCALAQARAYLDKLGSIVRQLRAGDGGAELAGIRRIALADCLPEGVHAGALERHWHADNLKQIVERGLFPAARKAPARPGHAHSVIATIYAMLGRLGRSGV